MEKSIQKFAETMQYKLDKNKHKECPHMNPDGKGRHWNHCGLQWLHKRCQMELAELAEALDEDDLEGALLECADVGNFAMMMQDNIRVALENKKAAINRSK